jgi:hypothetical protein
MTTPAGDEVTRIIDRLIALPKPASGDVMRTLGIIMAQQPGSKMYEEFEGKLPSGPLDKVTQTQRLDMGTGSVNLSGREGAPVFERDINMSLYGPVPPGRAYPHIPPEGTMTYIFSLHEGRTEIHFDYLYRTRSLRVVSLRWLPKS